jgi:hypothetical protein
MRPVTPTPLQVCFYDGYSWNINDALKFVADRDPQLTDIDCWVNQLSEHEINEEHWPAADLSKPLIIARMPHTGEWRPIDGWHRIRRAHAEGISSLPAHFLSQEEERKIRGHEPE